MKDNFTLPDHLKSNILRGILSEEKNRARKLLVISIITAFVSIGSILASVKYALTSFYQSSFYSYATLLFSDPDVVMRYWREFGLALLESLPVVGVILCLAAFFALLISLRMFARNMRFGITQSFAH